MMSGQVESPPAGQVIVRAAKEQDLAALNELHNHYIATSHVTFDLEPMTLNARREWFSHYGETGRYRVLIADAGGPLLGYASSSRFRPKPGYETSVETSIYLAPGAIGRGIGVWLYEALFHALEGQDLHRAYAGITQPNPASVRLHERFGFRQVAYFTEQGRKLGRYWDVAWFEKPLGAEPSR
jgi:phosphinothricin acetyltransferase